jgi:hypothetical protein
VQGKTLDYFILSIGPRFGMKPSLSLTDLHVLVSRVRLGKRLYVIGFDPQKEMNHLRRLKPSVLLAIWEAGLASLVRTSHVCLVALPYICGSIVAELGLGYERHHPSASAIVSPSRDCPRL